MDVHPPHGAIHGWRDFFVHLIVITLGLLIALGLEGIVEWAAGGPDFQVPLSVPQNDAGCPILCG